MTGKGKTPKYAVRLVVLFVFAGVIFFGGLRFFVPEGSKLTGSYDAQSLRYIASAPVSYAGPKSCGATNCHVALFNKWSGGAHGAREEKSKCEVCHGPQGKHPEQDHKLLKVRGDGDIVELCLSCHRRMKARSATGQPQISPQEHPYPHKEVLNCMQCHDPHSPEIGKPKGDNKVAKGASSNIDKSKTPDDASLASNCFSCHGPSGRGGFAPELASQSYEVLKDKLTRFRSGKLTGAMMNPLASKLTDKEIDTFARYFAKQ